MIYSHETILFLHDLPSRDLVAYCVTVPIGYNTSKLNQDGWIVHTIKKELFISVSIPDRPLLGMTLKYMIWSVQFAIF